MMLDGLLLRDALCAPTVPVPWPLSAHATPVNQG